MKTTTQQIDKPNNATRAIHLLEAYPIFEDQQGQVFIELVRNDHIEIWPIDSPSFTDWLSHEFYTAYGNAPGKAAIKDAISTLKGKAKADNTIRKTYTRVADIPGGYCLDLGSSSWDCVEITTTGWEVKPRIPVAYYRPPGQREVLRPRHGGDLDTLKSFVNLPEHYWPLGVAWLLECLRPETDYPLIILEGEQGTAKSTTQQYLKTLIDPTVSPLRHAPTDAKDLYIGAASEHILSYNNLSSLNPRLQDALCCLATGGSFNTRALYTDRQESVIDSKRPVILNGIATLGTQQDLIERALYFELPEIPPERRQIASDMAKAFLEAIPDILGALLSLMSQVLAVLPKVPRDNLHRLADFNLLLRALAVIDGHNSRTYDALLTENQRHALAAGLDASPIYTPLVRLLENRPNGFYGTYANLRHQLERYVDSYPLDWPKTDKRLADLLKRDAPALRKFGIAVKRDKTRRKEGYYVAIAGTQ